MEFIYEMIHFYHGHPLTLYYMPDVDSLKMEKVVLGSNPQKDEKFFQCLPTDRWFTRLCESDNPEDYSLVGASVAPGFDFNDLKTATYESIRLRHEFPEASRTSATTSQ